MVTILSFVVPASRFERLKSTTGDAEIVFFPGVRYEHVEETKNTTDLLPGRKACLVKRAGKAGEVG